MHTGKSSCPLREHRVRLIGPRLRAPPAARATSPYARPYRSPCSSVTRMAAGCWPRACCACRSTVGHAIHAYGRVSTGALLSIALAHRRARNTFKPPSQLHTSATTLQRRAPGQRGLESACAHVTLLCHVLCIVLLLLIVLSESYYLGSRYHRSSSSAACRGESVGTRSPWCERLGLRSRPLPSVLRSMYGSLSMCNVSCIVTGLRGGHGGPWRQAPPPRPRRCAKGGAQSMRVLLAPSWALPRVGLASKPSEAL